MVPNKPRLAKAVRSTLNRAASLLSRVARAAQRGNDCARRGARSPKGMWMSPEAVNAAFRQAAFKFVHIIEIHPYHYASIFAANSN